jgi:hypothetical protein
MRHLQTSSTDATLGIFVGNRAVEELSESGFPRPSLRIHIGIRRSAE